MALAPADVADLLLPEPEPVDVDPLGQRVLEALAGGALFFRELSDRVALRPANRSTTPRSPP